MVELQAGLANRKQKKHRRVNIKIDVNSLAHTTWNCKYHIIFAPKYWRQEIYGKIKKEIGEMLRKLCEWKKVEIIEATFDIRIYYFKNQKSEVKNVFRL